jgi:hypothetical protein
MRAKNPKALPGICSESRASHLIVRKFYAAGLTPAPGNFAIARPGFIPATPRTVRRCRILAEKWSVSAVKEI